MITDDDVFPRFSYMNDAGQFGGWVLDCREIDGTAEVVITRYGPGNGWVPNEREVARRPITEGQDYREIIMEYPDEREVEVYEREGWGDE